MHGSFFRWTLACGLGYVRYIMSLLQRVEDVALARHLARATIDCYLSWIADFLRFCRTGTTWRHPRELRAIVVEAYLTHLARDRRVSASTQNQAMCAIVFLYKQVLIDDLGSDHLGKFEAQRARRPARAPTVLSGSEVDRLMSVIEPGVDASPDGGAALRRGYAAARVLRATRA